MKKSRSSLLLAALLFTANALAAVDISVRSDDNSSNDVIAQDAKPSVFSKISSTVKAHPYISASVLTTLLLYVAAEYRYGCTRCGLGKMKDWWNKPNVTLVTPPDTP